LSPSPANPARLLALLVAVVALGALWLTPAASAAETSEASYLVTFAAGTPAAEQDAAIAAAGATDVSSVAPLRLHNVTAGATAADALRADSSVASVEADRTRDASATPSDPGFSSQWSLSRIGWDQLFGTVNPAGSATVAILDTGVDSMHEDLAGKVLPGTSLFDPFSDGTNDPNGHGTEMAGIVAASADNGIGVAGVGYAGVNVMPVQVLNAQGTGQDSDIIQGIVYAADHGADVILMSFSNPGFSQGLQDAIDYAWSRGAVLVAAAGNDGSSTPHYPAGDHAVVGVGNTDQSDALDPSSNYGPDVFMAAPGTGIYTTALGNGYTTISGTSAAAAAVAGSAGLLKATDPAASNGVVVGRLARNADAVASDSATGNGRLNVARAAFDTASDPVEPNGAAPVGAGGPFVGPYTVAAGSLTVAPTSGSSGTSASVTTAGGVFAGNSSVTIRWDDASTGTNLGTCATNGGGNVNAGCSIAIPAATAGPHTIFAVQGGVNVSNTFTVISSDTTPPTVASINRAAASPTNAGSISWNVAFSEPVTGVDAGDFSLTRTGAISGGSITGITGSGTSYTVTASTGTGTGTLGLDVTDNDTIVDGAGNKLGGTGAGNGNFTGQVYAIDRTAPTTTASATVTGGATYVSDTWTNKDVSLSLAGSDTGGSGLAATFYTVNGGTQTTYSTPVSFTTAGTYTVTYWSTDNLGNTEAQKTFIVKIDKTAPATTATATVTGGSSYASDTWTNKDVSLSLAASDTGGSGLAATFYTVNGGSQTSYSGAISFTSAGTYTVTYWSTDNAGNKESDKTFTVKIDKTAPTTAAAATVAGGASYVSDTWTNKDVSLTLSPTDAGGSGLAGTFYTVNGGSQTSYSGAISFTTAGTYTVTYWSTDSAGNKESDKTFTVKIDKTTPTSAADSPQYSNAGESSFTVSYHASDAASGLATVQLYAKGPSDSSYGPVGSPSTPDGSGNGSFTYTPSQGDGTYRFYTRASDNAGTVEDAPVDTDTVTIVADDQTLRDTAAPTTADDYDGGWHNSDVTVTLTPTDPGATATPATGSGVASTHYTLNGGSEQSGTSILVTAPASHAHDGANPISYYSADNAGNTEAAKSTSVKIDTVKPQTSAAATVTGGADYSSGAWTNKNVALTLSAADAGTGATPPTGSGVDKTYYTIDGGSPTEYTDAIPFTAEGTYTVSYWSTDKASNSEDAQTFTVKIDKTAPTIDDKGATTSPNAAGWFNHDVTNRFEASDAASGLDADCLAAFPLAAGHHVQEKTTAGADGEHKTVTSDSCTDVAGNSAAAVTSAEFKIDQTKPTSSADSPTYNNDDTITVTYTATDNLSGVKAVDLYVKKPGSGETYHKVATDTAGSATDPIDHKFDYAVPADGSGLLQGTYSFYTVASDQADNSEAATGADTTTTQSLQDSIKPNLSVGHTTNGSNGWNTTSSVTVTVTASDAGSGLDASSPSCAEGTSALTLTPAGSGTWTTSVSGDGSHSVDCQATDNATNQETASDTVKIDTIKPTITDKGPTTTPDGQDGWYSHNVTNTFEASDAGSGLNPACITNFPLASGKYTQTKTTSGESGHETVSSNSCTDVAGNTASAVTSATFKVDKTKPTTSDSVDNDWHNSAVQVTLTRGDGDNGSGVVDTYYEIGTTPAEPTTASPKYDPTHKPTLNNGEKIRYFSVDKAGNAETPHTSTYAARVDTAKPTSSASSPQYDKNGAINVSYTAGDTGGSGLKQVVLWVKTPGGSWTSSQTDGSPATTGHSFTVTASDAGKWQFKTIATDNASNDETDTDADTSTVEDRSAPNITITTPSAATYVKGATLNASFGCNDSNGGVDVSGVDYCKGNLAFGSITDQAVAMGGSLDTAAVGPHTFKVSTADKAGNTDNKSQGYTVVYNSDGKFKPPVDNSTSTTTINSATAGQSIPVKFSLNGNQGLNIFATGYPESQQIITPSTLSPESVPVDTAGNSPTLTYDPGTDTYQFVWKTDKKWAGTSRQLVILLNDNVTYLRANFTFKK
jgi:hypothetical protein